MEETQRDLFAGSDYDPERDDVRLTGQCRRIFDLMRDGKWRTLAEIAYLTVEPPASVSAQLRHMRKRRFGSHAVHKRYLGDGLYTYQLEVNPDGRLPWERRVSHAAESIR